MNNAIDCSLSKVSCIFENEFVPQIENAKELEHVEQLVQRAEDVGVKENVSWMDIIQKFTLHNMPIAAAEKIHKEVIANAVKEISLKVQERNWINKSDVDLGLDKNKLNMIIAEYFFNIIFSLIEEQEKHENCIAVCHTDEIVFTNALDLRPIIATYALGPCVGIAGYEPDNQSGFLFHVSNSCTFKRSKEMLTERVMQMVGNSKTPIQLHLRSGWTGPLAPIIEDIEEWMVSMCNAGYPMVVVSKELRSYEDPAPEPKSISLDTRIGAIDAYYPPRSFFAKRNDPSSPLQFIPGQINIVYPV